MDYKPLCIICDIDGTIADKKDRSPYDWDLVGKDTPKKIIIDIINNYKRQGVDIIIISGRDECCRQLTQDWLKRNQVEYNKLFMRPNENYEKDEILKQQIYERSIKKHYEVFFVLDDRNKVVKMWRNLGLTCLQVAEGNF